jgi:predicted anti-sigma-YlaC factor YlaD
VDCDIAREALSAGLDGEDTGIAVGDLDVHLAGCQGCQAWYRHATGLNRGLYALTDDRPVDVVDAVLDQVVLRRRGRWRLPLVIALLVVAVAQLSIAVCSLLTPLGMPMAMPMSQHMDHESAAFNLAFGVILLLVGLNTTRAATQVPVLASFVGVLAVASVFDLADGAVDWARLATHLPVVVGLVLTVAVGRLPKTRPNPERTALPTRGQPLVRLVSPSRQPPVPVERTGNGRQDQPPAARRDVA